jgi:hypothetical protein
MSAPARAFAPAPRQPRRHTASLPQGHIHLPSVHIRSRDGFGFDYEEDLYVSGRGRNQLVRRVVRLVIVEDGEIALDRQTSDVLCPEELDHLVEILPRLMDEGDEEVGAAMQERGRLEYSRQLRIAAGAEKACAACGCSLTRSCSGGCIWATAHLCSRCV